MKKLMASVLAAGMVLSLAGCGSTGSSTAASTSSEASTEAATTESASGEATAAANTDASTLYLSIAPEPDRLDPHLNSAVDGAVLAVNSFVGLLTYDSEGNLAPGIAESWEESEDGLTYHACFAMLVDSDWEHGNYDQATMGTIYVYADWTIEATGTLELQKASSNSSISSNDAYSLEGAEYTVYSDEACTNEVGKLVTDSSGYAKLENVSEGWKWVEETKAPEGFWRDETVYKVYVEANATVRVNDTAVEDDPINDPAPILVQKLDGESWKTPQDPR